jgi:hypothetical protein
VCEPDSPGGTDRIPGIGWCSSGWSLGEGSMSEMAIVAPREAIAYSGGCSDNSGWPFYLSC